MEAAVDASKVEKKRRLEVLKKLGQSGFTPLEDTLVKAVNTVIASQSKNWP